MRITLFSGLRKPTVFISACFRTDKCSHPNPTGNETGRRFPAKSPSAAEGCFRGRRDLLHNATNKASVSHSSCHLSDYRNASNNIPHPCPKGTPFYAGHPTNEPQNHLPKKTKQTRPATRTNRRIHKTRAKFILKESDFYLRKNICFLRKHLHIDWIFCIFARDSVQSGKRSKKPSDSGLRR